MSDLLQQGIAAARAGRKAEARELLTQVVEADERSEQGWLWLSGVVEAPDDMRTCLENVLEINPDNAKAKQGLAWIAQRYGPAKPPAPAPETTPPTPARPAPEVELERSVGSAVTHTTTSLSPVPAAPAKEPPAPPKRTPSPPTERFKAFVPPEVAPVIAAPSSLAPAAVVPASRPAPAADPTPTTVYAAAPAVPVENPCPFCGAPTTLAQKRCTQCRNDLMVRGAPPEHRSLSLLLLGGLWRAGGALWLALALVQLVGLLMVGWVFGDVTRQILGIAISMLIAVFYFFVGNNLLRRERWAYFVNMALVAINILFTLGIVAFGALFVALLRAGSETTPFVQNASAIIGFALIVMLLAFVIAPIVMSILCYRDFYGPWTRFRPAVEDADHVTHYNNGIAYRNRGMWFMAAREWEAAVSKKPREANYLHALGLAYAQIKRFEQARATLDRALQAAPENPSIKESRALIERQTSQAAR